MATMHKVTFYQVDGLENGWSNSLFCNLNQTNLGPGNVLGEILAQVWAPLMGTGVQFTYLRDSRDDIRGDGMLDALDRGSILFKGDANKPMEQPGSAILVQCSNNDRTRKKAIYLHGVWDTAITAKGIANPPGWAGKVTAFIAELKANWGWKRVKDRTEGGKVVTNVTAAVQLPSGAIKFTFADNLWVPDEYGYSSQLWFRGLQIFPKQRNPIVVVPSAAKEATTINKYDLVNFAGATALKNGYVFQPIINVDFVRPVIKEVGRPFNPSVGGRDHRRTQRAA